MMSYINNEMAAPRWDRPLLTLIDNFTRCAVVGQMRSASCATAGCALLEHELSIKRNLAAPDDGGAHRKPEADSRTTRPRRRRCRPPAGYLSIAQLSEQAGVGLSTAYSWMYSGRIPAAKWRGMIVVAESDAVDFLSVTPLSNTDATESGR